MKKNIFLLLLIFSTAFAFAQGVKISQLPGAPGNISGGIAPMSLGSTTYKVKVDSIAAMAHVQIYSSDGSVLLENPGGNKKLLNVRTATAAAGDRIISYGGGVILDDSTITAIPNIIIQRGSTKDTISSSQSWDLTRETSGVYRMYLVIVDSTNALDTIRGGTDTINAIEPPLPNGAIKFATITVIGNSIGDPHLVSTWQHDAVVKINSNGKQVTDSADFAYKDHYLTVGGTTPSDGTAGIIYAADRARDVVGLSGRLFNVGSGTGGGGVYDLSKSFRFANRGNNYLTIGSTGNTNHIMQLQNGTKIHYRAPIRTSMPDSIAVFDGDTLVKTPASLFSGSSLQQSTDIGDTTTNSVKIKGNTTGAALWLYGLDSEGEPVNGASKLYGAQFTGGDDYENTLPLRNGYLGAAVNGVGFDITGDISVTPPSIGAWSLGGDVVSDPDTAIVGGATIQQDVILLSNNKKHFRIRRIVGSIELGENAIASGGVSVAASAGRALGNFSFASGAFDTASGNSSTAFGEYGVASGQSSFIVGGYGNKATGLFSTAAGQWTRAAGNNSSAWGSYNIAKSVQHFVVGRLNDTTGLSVNDTTTLFTVGNGSQLNNSRRNILNVTAKGIGIGDNTMSPGAVLHIVKHAGDLTPVIIADIPTFADDTAAGVAGLTAGMLYKTSAGVLMVKL